MSVSHLFGAMRVEMHNLVRSIIDWIAPSSILCAQLSPRLESLHEPRYRVVTSSQRRGESPSYTGKVGWNDSPTLAALRDP